MKIWGVFCLISFITTAHARIIDVADKSDVIEERSGLGVSPKDESENKPDPSSFLREGNDGLTSVSEEIEKPEPYMIITTDTPSAPGGGVPALDPNVIAEMILPPFAEAERPWWERWWNGITAWFSSGNSGANSSEQP